MKTLIRIALIATILTWVTSLFASPAIATPSNVRIASVFQCGDSDCSEYDHDPLGPNAAVNESVRIDAHAESSVGLEWMRVEARREGGEWVCLMQWSLSGSSADRNVAWDTNVWPGTVTNPPGSCPAHSAHGDPTRNGNYDVRVVAKEKTLPGVEDTTRSSVVELRVNNRPSVPEWASDPSVSGESDGAPVVTLRWQANPEPDVAEYHFIRTDPNGDRWLFAVSAKNPGGQGCDRDGDVYTCEDDVLLESNYGNTDYAGTREYVLYALRSSPVSGGCALSSNGCISSQSGDVRSASIEEPPPVEEETSGGGSGGTSGGSSGGGSGGSPSASPSASRSSSPSRSPSASASASPHVLGRRLDNSEFFQGEYEKTLPYGQNRVLVPGHRGDSLYAAGDPIAGTADDDRGPWTPLAAGLVLMLIAAHMARLLRAS
jgi:hypothetical protein